ncbi:AAA family ATPase [Pseudoalteromonas sp. SMS1]|uniref:AAA family ATPase n=1 Tax=Pseudoalteromonas sp. SMS1 TaxID=2908894 RepID=UPI001F3353DB|nr:AAA family ATPase [Pseudoalteromonas sp. SMS1]MCF2857003.1 AAA family ATPase [Pseudoalteromonas sp. SMS1]
MEIFEINEVFTPTKPARANFVKRKVLDKRVGRALKTPGMQLVLYGHSGSGKTTLLLNKLKELELSFLKTNCTSNMSFDDLLSNVYVNLDKELSTKEIDKNDQEGGGSLGIPKVFSFTSKSATGSTLEKSFVSAYDSIELSLAKAIGENDALWVIEDFHKLQTSVKEKLSQLMKIFMDLSDEFPKLKIVAIGAKNTAREVVELDCEMQTRVSEIHVPLMSDEEISRIINNGAELLNISANAYVVNDVVEHSHGVASICHQLCLLMCEFADIEGTDAFYSDIELDFAHFNYAATEYIEQVSDTLKSAFQKAIKVDNSYEILACLASSDIEGVEVVEILEHINETTDSVELSMEELKESLKLLSSTEYGSVLFYIEVSERYSFKDPFYKMFGKLFLSAFSSGKKKKSKAELFTLFNKLIDKAKSNYTNSDNNIIPTESYFDEDNALLENKWKKSEPKIERKVHKNHKKKKNFL